MDLSVVDMAVNRVGVEHSRVALLGISFGGYFVLRATAVDDRVAAVVANSPVVDLRAYLTANPNWPGAGRLELVLVLADGGAESPMETRLRLVLVDGGLPRPVTQLVVWDGSGRFVARVDLAYEDRRLAIEYDGDHHRDRATFQRDLRRQNALQACGWTVLRFTAADIYGDPGRVVAIVRAALAS